MKTISGVLAALLVSAPLWGQIKVATITDENDAASKAVMDDLRCRTE
jgi:hypothetical protein